MCQSSSSCARLGAIEVHPGCSFGYLIVSGTHKTAIPLGIAALSATMQLIRTDVRHSHSIEVLRSVAVCGASSCAVVRLDLRPFINGDA